MKAHPFYVFYRPITARGVLTTEHAVRLYLPDKPMKAWAWRGRGEGEAEMTLLRWLVDRYPRCRATEDRRHQAGFSILEISLVLAIIGILAVLATPMFITYYQGARLRVAAEEVAAFINHGRQLGIKENDGVCVHITPTAIHYHLETCAGTTWIGPGSDAAGNVKVPDGVTLTTTADPVFSYLGAASPPATYTVTNTQTGSTLRVFVSTSGRVTIGP